VYYILQSNFSYNQTAQNQIRFFTNLTQYGKTSAYMYIAQFISETVACFPGICTFFQLLNTGNSFYLNLKRRILWYYIAAVEIGFIKRQTFSIITTIFLVFFKSSIYSLLSPLQVDIIAYLQRAINIVHSTVIETIDKTVQCK